MANKGDLWDDSVLLTAFAEAISSYKKMHGMKANDVSNDDISEDQTIYDANVETQQAIRQENKAEENNPQLNTCTEAGESGYKPSSGKENQLVKSIDPNAPNSPAEVCVDPQKSYSHSQSPQEYNELLNQYQELELKRQEIVNQLYQYGAWNYQYPNEAYNYGTQSANDSNPNAVSSCCPYVGQCFASPCTSAPSYCLVPPCADSCGPTGHRKCNVPREESDIVRTAMGAAERAMSSLKMKITDDAVLDEANKGKENDSREGMGISSSTDLSEVLNAWYSAGFFTGKYLVEQSAAKKRQS